MPGASLARITPANGAYLNLLFLWRRPHRESPLIAQDANVMRLLPATVMDTAESSHSKAARYTSNY